MGVYVRIPFTSTNRLNRPVIWSSFHTSPQNIDSPVTSPNPKERSGRLSPLFDNLLNLQPMLTKQKPLWPLLTLVARVALYCHWRIASFIIDFL